MVEAIEKISEKYPITAILDAVGLPQSTWYYHQNQKVQYQEKYEEVIENIRQIIQEHPGYGYPKIKRELDRNYDESAGYTVVRKLLNRTDLSMKRNARKGRRNGYRKAISEAGSSVNLLRSRDDIDPFDVICTDFTELIYDEGRLVAKLMPVVGYKCKMIYGWALGRSADTGLALKALEDMLETLERLGVDPEGMMLHQDQDAVYTGKKWADRILHDLDMEISYSADGAKENPMMESTIGHFKSDAFNRFYECSSMEELETVVDEQVKYWNKERMHSSIDYRTPEEFVESLL